MWKTFKLAPLSLLIYPVAALLSWVATLLAWILSPLIAGISVVKGTDNVGGFLSYFYTHNASLDGGIAQGVKGYKEGLTGFKLWWQRTCWVCRNPAYKFCAYILGFSGDGAKLIYEDGSKIKPYGYWYVVETAKGWKFFGYRGKRCWVGWNYRTYGGRHQLKSKPF